MLSNSRTSPKLALIGILLAITVNWTETSVGVHKRFEYKYSFKPPFLGIFLIFLKERHGLIEC